MFLRQRYESCDLLGHIWTHGRHDFPQKTSGLRDHWPGWVSWSWQTRHCRILSHSVAQGCAASGRDASSWSPGRRSCCCKRDIENTKVNKNPLYVAMLCYAMLCNVMALHMISCSQKRFIVWKSVMVSWSPLTSLPRYTKFVSASEISSAPGRKHWFLVWSLRQELKAQPDSIDEEARNQAKSGSKKNDTWDLQRWGACIMPRDSLLFPWGPWCRTGEVDDVALFVELASERILVSRRWIDCHSLPFIAIHCHLLPLPVPCQNCSLAPGDS